MDKLIKSLKYGISDPHAAGADLADYAYWAEPITHGAPVYPGPAAQGLLITLKC